MSRKYRRSRQRERVLELLKNTGTHPTATWIYDRLKEEFPGLSPGTVYRNLGILIEQGLVRKIDFGSTFDRYDANTDPHYHFICERCGAIIDLGMPVNEELNRIVEKQTHHKATRHRIEFYGICEECAKKTEG